MNSNFFIIFFTVEFRHKNQVAVFSIQQQFIPETSLFHEPCLPIACNRTLIIRQDTKLYFVKSQLLKPIIQYKLCRFLSDSAAQPFLLADKDPELRLFASLSISRR